MKNYTQQIREVDKLHNAAAITHPYGYVVDRIHSAPLRKKGKYIRPIRNVNIQHQQYKDVDFFIIDNATTLIVFDDKFSCIYDTSDIGYLCEFIDTIDGTYNYDDDEDNGNINAIYNAWYTGGMMSW